MIECKRFISSILLASAILSFTGCTRRLETLEDSYALLDSIRDAKKRMLDEHLADIARGARAIRTDTLLTRFFRIKNEYYQLQKRIPPPPEAHRAIVQLKQRIKQRYIERYLSFYDILCINTDGDIFYTIRKQADYHRNVFADEFRGAALAQRLQTSPRESFVDFQYYDASGEPSAFFIEPVLDSTGAAGWFALQYAANKLNNILQNEAALGATGEVILVNRDRYLLTNSRFRAASTILKQQLPEENIEEKFRRGRGRKSVIDYRGFRVLSSFDTCSVLGSKWLLIVKKHKSEILTAFYRKNRRRLRPRLLRALAEPVAVNAAAGPAHADSIVEVDMDEYRRIDAGAVVFTHGVSTCTAVDVTMPGRFSYLCHLSTRDAQAGGVATDLVGGVLTRITDLEVLRYELPRLRITIIAPHCRTIDPIIDTLLDRGIFLSQITFMHCAGNRYANCWCDPAANTTTVEWVDKTGAQPLVRQRAREIPNAERLLCAIIADGAQ